MTDVDDFLAECDDVIEEWDGSPDAASWRARVSESIQWFTWGDTRTVTFTPVRTDDLKPHAQGWVGRSFEVEFTGTMDMGTHAGEPMWRPTSPDVMGGLVTWLADCDLTDVGASQLTRESHPCDSSPVTRLG